MYIAMNHSSGNAAPAMAIHGASSLSFFANQATEQTSDTASMLPKNIPAAISKSVTMSSFYMPGQHAPARAFCQGGAQ